MEPEYVLQIVENSIKIALKKAQKRRIVETVIQFYQGLGCEAIKRLSSLVRPTNKSSKNLSTEVLFQTNEYKKPQLYMSGMQGVRYEG